MANNVRKRRNGTQASQIEGEPHIDSQPETNATEEQSLGETPPSRLPSGPTESHLNVQQIPVDAMVPNPWNPNRMDDVTRAKLRAYVRREGLIQPLIVRPHPVDEDCFQILGGYHRWTVCKEDLGYTHVPCVVVEVDDRRAKVLTINLNELSGKAVPHLLAELLHDLNRDTTLKDLESQLPYTQRELQDSLELLKIPDGLALELERQVQQHRDGTPTQMTFLVDEAEPVQKALDHVMGDLHGKNRRGRALVAICQAYLRSLPAETVST